MKPGIAINPGTPVSWLSDVVEDADMILIMSVNPGFGGQKFIEHSTTKVKQLREILKSAGSNAIIQVDGGINDTTGKIIAEAGADMLVAGSYVFKAANPINAIDLLADI